ncbi:hypothetical protein ABRT01_07450 [Lentibacillus sp. L22]|uniref:hypothetical protein n=1 Tax=Lentibacillus daqui TaxID=2911514 RepID=UPI0022B15F5D|nr:hypothetical protein [Lentibacillus daqui]
MGEQEQYKKILKNIIDQAENLKIQTSEQLIQVLVNELKSSAISSDSLVNK